LFLYIQVWYHIGRDNNILPENRLVLQTNGVLLHKLTHNPTDIYNYSCIIIDEFHERQTETDVLLAVIKSIVQQERIEKGRRSRVLVYLE
jgi:HrpA-like RNA helicase